MRLYVDGVEAAGFNCHLESGREGAVDVDHVLDYNCDPAYLADLPVNGPML